MDRGSDFESEFRARRIRLRGNFAHKSLVKLSTVPPKGNITPTDMHAHIYTNKVHACEMHAYEMRAHEVHAYICL